MASSTAAPGTPRAAASDAAARRRAPRRSEGRGFGLFRDAAPVLFLAAVALGFCGCGGGPGEEEDSPEAVGARVLRVGCVAGPGCDAVARVAAAWRLENDLVPETLAYETSGDLLADGFDPERRPSFDLAFADLAFFLEAAARDALVELPPGVIGVSDAARRLGDSLPAPLAGRAVPARFDPLVATIRADGFEDLKTSMDFEERFGRPLAAPRAWGELIDLAAFFNRPDRFPPQAGLSLPDDPADEAFPFVFEQLAWLEGRDLASEASEDGIDAAGASRALEAYREALATAPADDPSTRTVRSLEPFLRGGAAMALGFAGEAERVAEAYGAERIFVAPIPPGEAPGADRVAARVEGFVMPVGLAKARRARAIEFLQWFVSGDGRERWTRIAGALTGDAGADDLAGASGPGAALVQPAVRASLPRLAFGWAAGAPIASRLDEAVRRVESLGRAIEPHPGNETGSPDRLVSRGTDSEFGSDGAADGAEAMEGFSDEGVASGDFAEDDAFAGDDGFVEEEAAGDEP